MRVKLIIKIKKTKMKIRIVSKKNNNKSNQLIIIVHKLTILVQPEYDAIRKNYILITLLPSAFPTKVT